MGLALLPAYREKERGEREREIAVEERKRKKRSLKMIYRKWSLLTGPAAILGGIVATVVVANYILVQNVCSLFRYSNPRYLNFVFSLYSSIAIRLF
ncbi:hypothetical protein LguiA_027010 [Lonicera macranthoides]